jgi:hypothetical protein
MYFEVCEPKRSIVLMIVLLHSAAAHLEKFIRAVTTGPPPRDDRSKPGIPFASSLVAPFAVAGGCMDFMIRNPWQLWTDGQSFSSTLAESSDYRGISLIGKVSAQLMAFESLSQFSLTSDAFRQGPLLVTSLPQRPFFLTSVVSLSQVEFRYGSRNGGRCSPSKNCSLSSSGRGALQFDRVSIYSLAEVCEFPSATRRRKASMSSKKRRASSSTLISPPRRRLSLNSEMISPFENRALFVRHAS